MPKIVLPLHIYRRVESDGPLMYPYDVQSFSVVDPLGVIHSLQDELRKAAFFDALLAIDSGTVLEVKRMTGLDAMMEVVDPKTILVSTDTAGRAVSLSQILEWWDGFSQGLPAVADEADECVCCQVNEDLEFRIRRTERIMEELLRQMTGQHVVAKIDRLLAAEKGMKDDAKDPC